MSLSEDGYIMDIYYDSTCIQQHSLQISSNVLIFNREHGDSPLDKWGS